MKHFSFPYNKSEVPLDGIYILFERDERGHGGMRIVRVGTHTGKGQLRPRLEQHFLVENKDRSIFRKNIGRAILQKRNDPYLSTWDIDFTTKHAREEYGKHLDTKKQKSLEREISAYIQQNFTFVVIPVKEKVKRLTLESQIISTVSLCEHCKPSRKWLGNYSTKEKIRESGLWLVNELYKKGFTEKEFTSFCTYVRKA